MKSFKQHIEYTKLRIKANKAREEAMEAEEEGNEEDYEKYAMIAKYWEIQAEKLDMDNFVKGPSQAEMQAQQRKYEKERDALEAEILAKYDVNDID